MFFAPFKLVGILRFEERRESLYLANQIGDETAEKIYLPEQ